MCQVPLVNPDDTLQSGTDNRIRTCGLLFRRQLLLSTELYRYGTDEQNRTAGSAFAGLCDIRFTTSIWLVHKDSNLGCVVQSHASYH